METDVVRAIIGATCIQRQKAAPLNINALFDVIIEQGADVISIEQVSPILPEE